ncbi:MAG: O-antigen ligase family protein [Atopobiaceae bacterium]|nr:O-antigen ligase family protein [Atopobiaceae bacterium]
MIGIRIRRSEILNILALIPFFEPFSISLLASNSTFWTVVSGGFALARYIISYIYILKTLMSANTIKFNSITILCIIFIIVRIAASMLNGSLYFGFAISAISYVGYIFQFNYWVKTKGLSYVISLYMKMFGIFFVIGIISIVIYPNGLNMSSTKTQAIYLLGSKNSSFFYFFGFLSFYGLWILINNRRKTILIELSFVAAMVASLICESSNSFASILLLCITYFCIKESHKIYKHIPPRFMLMTFIIFVAMLLVGNILKEFTPVLQLIGRDSTLSGRDYIWHEQLTMIQNSFLWGNGINTRTTLMSSAIATHAHNFYLDTFVKFGIASLGCLLLALYVSAANISSMSRNKYRGYLVGVLLTLLLHSVFDDVSIYLLITVLLLTGARKQYMKVK